MTFRPSQLKILIALDGRYETAALRGELECLGHRVQHCRELGAAVRMLRDWAPDLIVTGEQLGRDQVDGGLRLAEYCRITEDRVNGWPGTRTILLIPVLDWDRFKRAQRTGAHVILDGNADAVMRYVQTISDNIVTDRMLGPALVVMHRFRGEAPSPVCKVCEWAGAFVSYGSSQAEIQLTPVRTALLNILLFRRRGQSSITIVNACAENSFIQKILRGRKLRESALKMEITRLRQDIERGLVAIGAPYSGTHFLPLAAHNSKMYFPTGNRRLIHIPGESFDNIKIR